MSEARTCTRCGCPEERHHPISCECPLPYGGFTPFGRPAVNFFEVDPTPAPQSDGEVTPCDCGHSAAAHGYVGEDIRSECAECSCVRFKPWPDAEPTQEEPRHD